MRTFVILEKKFPYVFFSVQFEQATGAIPDESLPIANQLEIAIVKIKEHIKTIIYSKAETERMQEVK